MRINKLWRKLFVIAFIKVMILVFVIKPIFFPKFKDQFDSKESYQEFSIDAMTNTDSIDNNSNTLTGGKWWI